jgi:translation initiation factor IF-2
MFADTGEQVHEATPSMPVEVLGISGVPSAGDPFQVVESEKYARQIAQKRQELVRLESAQKVKKVTLEDLNAMIKEGEIKELKIVIKADVDGSVQALRDSLQKLSTSDIRVKVIHAATGGINESDVMLASASNAIIIGYQVRPSSKVAEIADKENVSIQYYNIIYDAIADVKAAMEGMLSPEMKEEITSTGEIKQTFKISKVGTIAGAVVLTGRLKRSDKIRLLRDSVVVFDGKLNSLKRFKNDAGEVEAGQECGFTLENFNDIKEGDTFESYQIIEIKKKLGDNSRR